MQFIQAKHHGGNENTPVTRLVIHATCPDTGYPSASRAGRAASTARYFQSTSRPTSAHYVCDVTATVQCLSEETIGYHAPPNAHSIGIEICADGGSKSSFDNPSHSYTREQWLSPQVWPAVERAAILARDICHRHHIPVRKLSTAQVKSGMSGICGHDNVSDAFHQSDHDDPGPYFPWDRFMAAITNTHPEELTMADVKELKASIVSAQQQLHHDVGVVQNQNGMLKKQIENLSWVKNPVTGKLWRTKDALWSIWYYILEVRTRLQKIENRLSDLERKVK
ncbi:N-acetylmuramoyl-L-alanine amidase [Cutibacterium sp. WCA-380-WT-3A]|uniref:N-acetylmuramoyl-L-alanine amidase n=1 Tax=Cutibacterium porci TaxID=2605781 RepID=A0A7K0J5R2_9ACTN|nr:N-acetylmuramoyl-L-alanine amidase [Cutibacterium porci]